ncbi:MAG: serine/threonine protein kinase [Candidatus Obscuribacterales bacterium]|nr:serine/threonine protein kinase [Candidatus Obscuribacterales bacterium]
MNNLTDDDEISIHLEQDPLIGQTLAGRYGIVSIIGRGGMGVVYKAKHLAMDRFVAVKTLHIGGDPEALRRFQQEAKAVSQVKHPHTVTLYDFGVSSEGQPFLVMELLNGISLREALKEGPLNLTRANEIFQQVVEALSCAHEAGVVHKDLKPENIMLSQKPGFGPDWVHVLDFGISTMSSSTDRPTGLPRELGKIVGSPPYMSPEQCSLSDVDHRSDIYSLAICLFECLSGGFPYKARTAIELLECHIAGKPRALREINVNTSTYESVSQLINKALEKKPDRRHEHIKLFGAELEEAVLTDSKRGLALKDRISMEVPRTAEFADLNKEIIDGLEDEDRHGKALNLLNQLRHMIYGDEGPHKDAKEGEKIVFFECPHCKAETQPDLSLCLCCGRSLATKDDFSKLRAARGDFSLPKQKSQQKETPKVSREFSQRTKAAMVKTGRAWTRSLGLLFLGLILIVCVFVVSGGYQLVVSNFKHPARN